MTKSMNIRTDAFCSSLLGLLDRRILSLVFQDNYAGKFPVPGQVLHPSLAGATVKFEKYQATSSSEDNIPAEWSVYASLVYGQDNYLECNLFRSTRFPATIAMGMKGKQTDTVFDFEPYRGRKILSVVRGGTGYSFSLEKSPRYVVPMSDVGVDIPDEELLARLPESKPLKIRGGAKTNDYGLYMSMPEVARKIVDVFLGQNKQMQRSDFTIGDETLQIRRSVHPGWLVQKVKYWEDLENV